MSAPLIVAHRGASADRPPGNTLEAFRRARELGADWVELDVRRTSDGSLAVHHDATLPDGRAIVDLAARDLPPWVPLLDAALDACAGLGVNVEVKNMPGEPDWDEDRRVVDLTLAALADSGRPPEQILVTSFDPGSIDRVRAVGGWSTGLLLFELGDRDALLARVRAAGHDAVNPWDPLVDQALVSAAADHGLVVNVWTVDDSDRMAELAGFGVAGVITNRPDVARATLRA